MIGQWYLNQLKDQFGGLVTQDVEFSGVSTDTRSITKGDLFVALVGPNFDGHDYVEQAFSKGAVAAVVSRSDSVSRKAAWVVDDTRIALADIAKANRQRFEGPVYAVTGSSGKTTVKEMLHAILSQNAEVLATKGNLNNDIGVPLTLFSLKDQHEIAVIEQGASARGEIAYTTDISCPDVAILNNAMGAHLEGFGSLQGVVESKAEIFSRLSETGGHAIINLDDPHADWWLSHTEGLPRLTFSARGDLEADLWASDLAPSDNGCFAFVLHRNDEQIDVQLQVMGQHNVANALAAASAVSAQGMSLKDIASGLGSFSAVSGRMRPLKSARGALVIDDSYNANPGSVNAAMDLLVSLPGESVLVLGDMAELGADAAEQHEKVGCRAAQKGTDRFWAIGALSRHSVAAYDAAAGKQGQHFKSHEELIAALADIAEQGVNILIKGSRSAAMDRVVKGLTEGE
ncbi:UDP-N-acetylmuramoyl-tripeptide--D-alanyl-D-alanine ligase [Neptuniibacter caesariensis]|uniref:UDP-N-acetylmuramoyl-tripeptide--D-alanyl-D-alanine ligase n=1 Tax=Neptuniibacter caesariensis TaxID=207954 RepID=A0A7U8C4F9_NEPCE|nr:UDP-N-acetylmuramoyl-tripeptide--D-alanyl-D-alanine ligase [Neptuniibacter caesariensis]EAR59721.1 UDP-N-acetylmuramoylalanyl-D-glutamyl-2,6-diaminopimelate--D-alanyl-D-alanyl ligase [Oceanospirillum sp. MED92] [Neptuniibacter caesariensis]